MNEHEFRDLLAAAGTGSMSRRGLMQRLVAAGLSAPAASQILVHAGVAMARSPSDYKPARRGGGGSLKVLLWQAPRSLTPHFLSGNAEREASRPFYEPLAGWDNDGNLRPALAAEIPSREDGTLSSDGKSVVWKLKQGVTWHDGQPFTADDVVFTWEFARDPASATTTISTYRDIVVEKIDDHAVRIVFPAPTPFWALAFVGYNDMILPKHVFADYKGSRSREAPANLMPIGTGPYKCTAFKPGDAVAGVLNANYHMDHRPFFDSIAIKGGGDAVSAARAVLQTGEFDFAWNLQIEEEILSRLEKSGKGRVVVTNGGGIEHIRLNRADPWTEVDGERASLKTKHPLLSDLWPHGHRHGELCRLSGALPVEEHDVRIQHRQGQQPARQGGLGKGRRRHSREGRQETQAGLPNDNQPAAAEDPGHHQAGLPEGGHRSRTEDGRRVGLLLL